MYIAKAGRGIWTLRIFMQIKRVIVQIKFRDAYCVSNGQSGILEGETIKVPERSRKRCIRFYTGKKCYKRIVTERIAGG